MMDKRDKITDWLAIRQVFLEYKQTITIHIAENDNILTAHILKCMFWKSEPFEYK